MWPSRADYQQAIENPVSAFLDPDLKAAQPQMDKFGVPRVWSGSSAAVYMLSNGARKFAVRCFLKDAPDRAARYGAIKSGLTRSPYTVNFEYLEKGIQCSGKWVPVLKMEWVEGDLLADYLRKYSADSSRLRQLAQKWLLMSQRWRQAHVAHGDLQPPNVFVVGDELKLVDYDCIFVSNLSGLASPENGSENFQHPGRNPGHFGEYSDNFSDWIVYTSLIALSVDQKFMSFVSFADNALLFRKADFVQPQKSEVLKRLREHQEEELRALGTQLEKILSLPCDQVPALNPPVSKSKERSPVGFAAPAAPSVAPSPSAGHPMLLDSSTAASAPVRGHPLIVDSPGGQLDAIAPRGPLPPGAKPIERPSRPQPAEPAVAQDEPEPEPKKASGPPLALLASIIIFVLVAGGGAFFVMQNSSKPSATVTATDPATSTATSTATDPKAVAPSDLCQEGRTLLESKQYAEAVSKFSQALSRDPLSSAALTGRAAAYLELKRFADALDDYNKALSVDPDNKVLFKGRGRAYLALEQYLKAIADYKKAKSLGADDASLYSDLGKCYGGLTQYDQAIDYFNQSLEKEESANTYYLRGGTFYCLEKNKEAMADYQKAVALNPKDADAWFGVGSCYYCFKQYKQAQDPYKKAIALYKERGNEAWARKAEGFLKEVTAAAK